MPNKKQSHYCRVCGLDQGEPPWGDDGNSPTFGICYCCGVEFGYQDSSPQSTSLFRKKWLENGAEWDEEGAKPNDWSLEEQLKNIPEAFR